MSNAIGESGITTALGPQLSSPSVESPEGKWIARVQAGVLIVNQIESTFFQETGVRFQFSKYESRDRATIFGPDLDDCPILLALFSNGCDLCWQWSHGADFYSKERTNFLSSASTESFY